MRVARGVLDRAALLALVPGCDDDQRAGAEGGHHRLFLLEDPALAPQAEVDHPAPVVDRGQDPLDLVADGEVGARARVPEAQDGLRVDADDPDAVRRRGRNRRDRGSVPFLAPAVVLGVERRRVRAVGELGMRDVEPGVDDRQRHSRTRRVELVCADRRNPPLVRHERVCVLVRRAQQMELAVRRHRADEPEAHQRWEKALGPDAGHAPEIELRRDQAGAVRTQGRRGHRSADPVELDQRVRRVVQIGERGLRRQPWGHDRVAGVLVDRRGTRCRRSEGESDEDDPDPAHRNQSTALTGECNRPEPVSAGLEWSLDVASRRA